MKLYMKGPNICDSLPSAEISSSKGTKHELTLLPMMISRLKGTNLCARITFNKIILIKGTLNNSMKNSN